MDNAPDGAGPAPMAFPKTTVLPFPSRSSTPSPVALPVLASTLLYPAGTPLDAVNVIAKVAVDPLGQSPAIVNGVAPVVLSLPANALAETVGSATLREV